MTATRLSTKGQIVIPKAMRDALELAPGAVLELEIDGGRLVATPRVKPPKMSLDAFLDRIGPIMASARTVTAEDVDAALERMWDDDPYWNRPSGTDA